MSRQSRTRSSGRSLRKLLKKRSRAKWPLFEVTPLEKRLYLSSSLNPWIYGAATEPGVPSTGPYTLYFNATGTQASQVSSATVNWGDYIDGSADTQTVPVTQLGAPLATHTYPNGPGNYTITATAKTSNSSVPAGGLSLDPAFGGNNSGTNTTIISGTDAGYGIAIDTSTGRMYVAGYAGGNFAVTRYNSDGTPDTTFNGGSAPGGTAYAPGLQGTSSAVAVDAQGNIVVKSRDTGKRGRFRDSEWPVKRHIVRAPNRNLAAGGSGDLGRTVGMWANLVSPVSVALALATGIALRRAMSRSIQRRRGKSLRGPKSTASGRASVRRWACISLGCWFFVLVGPTLLDEDYSRGIVEHWPFLVALVACSAFIGFSWHVRFEEICARYAAN